MCKQCGGDQCLPNGSHGDANGAKSAGLCRLQHRIFHEKFYSTTQELVLVGKARLPYQNTLRDKGAFQAATKALLSV